MSEIQQTPTSVWTWIIPPVVGYALYKLFVKKLLQKLNQKLFSKYMAVIEISYNKAVRKHKPVLFGKLHEMSDKIKPRTLSILEIGAGTGANFKFFPDGCNVTCVDPNPFFDSYLKTKQELFSHLNIKDLIVGKAEDLSMIPNDTFDVVVCTLVLCSVNDVDQSLKEMKRVLKPGGKLLYLEHVRADEKSWVQYIQWLIKWPWWFFGDGCYLFNKTWENVDAAGFSNVSQERMWVYMKFPFCVVSPHVMGVATK